MGGRIDSFKSLGQRFLVPMWKEGKPVTRHTCDHHTMTSAIDNQASASDKQTKLLQDLLQLDVPAKYSLFKLARDEFEESYVGSLDVGAALKILFTFSISAKQG